MILVDTSAWYAFFVAEDMFHQDSRRVFEAESNFVTVFTVFEETLALLHHRQGKKLGLLAARLIPQISARGLEYVSRKENEAIVATYKALPRYIDYVDASLVYFSKKLDAPVFTFDEHFLKLKTPTVPKVEK